LKGGGAKQLKAFNLCDGTRTQGEIAKELSLDPANFSKTITRWAELGIVIRITEGRSVTPVHVYPLSDSEIKKAAKA
jgi:predicted transcriptional regulator